MDQINSLAAASQLSDYPVFQLDQEVQGGLQTARTVKINHPEIAEPIVFTIWSRFSAPQISDKKIARVLEYLSAWQQKRVHQLKKRSADPMSDGAEKRFRVALSFSGDRRAFVEQVADELASRLGREHVLYDKYFEAEFARLNLDTHLQHLYHNESELIAVFVCAGYETKEWCGLEWRAIRDRIKQCKAESVMLLRFDMTEVPGLFSHDGYIWIDDRTPEQIAEVILKRLEGQSAPGGIRGDESR